MKILETWSHGPYGILTDADPFTGGIIDSRIVDHKWFVILNRDDLEVPGEFDTREEAIAAAEEVLNVAA